MKEVQRVLRPDPIPFELNRDDGTTLVDDVMDATVNALVDSFDSKHGGFDKEEKFPRPCSLKLLMRQFIRGTGEDEESRVYLLKMLFYTLGALQDGGVHDHIAGGFHRYAVDQIWHVPHFEKMLVDNVQIAQACLSAAKLRPSNDLFFTARSTLDFLMREMRSPDGGFYSSQDADVFSLETGKAVQGAYYTWQAEEIKSALTEEEYTMFSEFYNVMDEGNCNLAATEEDEEHPTNVLFVQEKITELADRHDLDEEETREILSRCRRKLYKERQRRPQPDMDTKIVSGYNGMAISAFAEASRALRIEKNTSIEEAFPDDRTDPSVYLETALKVLPDDYPRPFSDN